MSGYISSSNNRFYVATEPKYGLAPLVMGRQRIPAVKLKAKQAPERADRKDKTGSRTFAGIPSGVRHTTTFGINTYMTAWNDQSFAPAHGPLIEAAMGDAVQLHAGGTISAANGTQISFVGAHGLSVGQAIAVNGELRFVANIADSVTVNVNAPFAAQVQAGAAAGPTATYRLATDLSSTSIFDYWSPATAVHRLIAGGAVDKFAIKVNGDFHEFEFSGGAADLIDSASFTAGQASLQAFPAEPDSQGFDYTIIPGHLGQAWIGSVPNQMFTLTDATVTLDNGIDLRSREFGQMGPRCIVAGIRKVNFHFSVFAQDEDEVTSLYQAARQMSPVSVMLQLGQQPKQLFGVYLKSVMPSVPQFDDSETRLQWSFSDCRAQGVQDDEIIVAFA
jgi:hypothetical protein